ncbi:MAG: glycerophosphodiester phosphodiesterase family protein [Gemmataceae bacterium]
MTDTLAVFTLVKSAAHDFRQTWGKLITFIVLFKFLEIWLLLPAIAKGLSALLAQSGHVAVSNFDVLAFLLTAPGLLYAALFGIAAIALLLLEQAGIMALADASDRISASLTLRTSFLAALGVIELASALVLLLTLALAPLVLLGALTYLLLLSQHDINFYIAAQPPVFWLAAAIGGVLALAAIAVCVWLYVRWSLVLPIVLFEQQPVRIALGASRDRVRGVGWRVAFVLLGWLLIVLVIGFGLESAFRLVASALLDRAGQQPIGWIAVLLTAQATLLGTIAALIVIGLGLLTRRLYLVRSKQPGTSGERGIEVEMMPSPPFRRLGYLAVTFVLLAPLTLWADLLIHASKPSAVCITAHRGHARAAPENTLSAISRAIESGADYAEIDVQLTADGIVVLLHDRDLKRVAGDSRRLDELTLEDLRKLDVGSWFDGAFAGESAPTLAEVIELSRGRIKLNIELKLFGPNPRLAREVARLVREKKFESECIVTAFDYEALQEVKRHDPKLRSGIIIAHALGDLSRLDLEILSVRSDWLSDDLIRSAHRNGQEVHVWTVNDPTQMTRLMKRGVDNVLTSDPDLGVRSRDEWNSLTESERLILAARLLLGLEP